MSEKEFLYVPTLKEKGDDYDIVFTNFRGIVMPSGVSNEVRDYWIDKFKRLSEDEAWQKSYLEKSMIENEFIPGDEFYNEIENELYPLFKEFLKEMSL